MNLDLETSATALARLFLPQHEFPSMHVAGSNGKGTLCAILSNAFTLSGVRCGLFTSPHLCRVEERIRVDGVPISSEDLDSALSAVRIVCESEPVLSPTYYEATFLAAMVHFSSACVQRAVIETGLGGRYDATRLVEADCCILTQISLEHTDLLGETLGEIAGEKAAIARPGRPLISLWAYDHEAREAIDSAVSSPELGCWWRPDRAMRIRFDEADEPHRPLPDIEEFDGWTTMHEDAADLATVALEMLGMVWTVAPHVQRALSVTRWPGRMQWLTTEEGCRVLLDSAHNPSGISRALREIKVLAEKQQGTLPNVLLLGCTSQIDLPAFIHPVVEYLVDAGVGSVVITQPQGGRMPGLGVEELASALGEQLPDVVLHLEADPASAFEAACLLVEEEQSLLCIGSLYLAGNILRHLGLDDDEALTILDPLEEEGMI